MSQNWRRQILYGNASATAQPSSLLYCDGKFYVSEASAWEIDEIYGVWCENFFLRADIRVDIFAIEYLWYKYDNSLYFTSSELYLILMFIFFFSLLPFSIPFIIESMYIIYSNVFSHLLGMYEYDMWTRSFQEAKIVWIDDWIEIEIERYVHDVS